MFLVGLTGGIGTGKSTAAAAFRKYGCAIIDGDVIAREVVQPGKPAWKKIKAFFGDSILQEDGTINRTMLGRIIFSDPQKRAALNSFCHPEIYKSMILKIVFHFIQGYQFVILDLPLLFETRKMLPLISYTVVVSCTEYQQKQRISQRDGLPREEIDQRIQAQMSLQEKCRRATFIIDNSGTEEMTETQVHDLVKKFRQSRAHWPVRILVFLVLFGFISTVRFIWS